MEVTILILGGKLTLINCTLDALPTYMMSLFPIHAGSSIGWITSGEISYGMGTQKGKSSIWSSGKLLFVARRLEVRESRI